MKTPGQELVATLVMIIRRANPGIENLSVTVVEETGELRISADGRDPVHVVPRLADCCLYHKFESYEREYQRLKMLLIEAGYFPDRRLMR